MKEVGLYVILESAICSSKDTPSQTSRNAHRLLFGRGDAALGGLGRREGGAPAWRGESLQAVCCCALFSGVRMALLDMGSLGTKASCCVGCLSDAGHVLLMTGSLANGAFSSLQQDKLLVHLAGIWSP